jgi:hypothetical protein
MGLFRKTLAVGTVGVVNGSSKKQRVAKQQLQATQQLVEAVRIASGQPLPQTRLQKALAEQLSVATEKARLQAELDDPATGPNRRAQLRNLLINY